MPIFHDKGNSEIYVDEEKQQGILIYIVLERSPTSSYLGLSWNLWTLRCSRKLEEDNLGAILVREGGGPSCLGK